MVNIINNIKSNVIMMKKIFCNSILLDTVWFLSSYCRSLWYSVQGKGQSQRQDRGHQEGEAGADRGWSAHVRAQRDLAAQAAGQVKPPKHCQVRNLQVFCEILASLHGSELTQLQMCPGRVCQWMISTLCCKITPLCALQLIQLRPLNTDWMRGSKTVFRGLTCHKWRNFVSRHQRNYEKYLIQNYFRLLDICHGQRIDGREMNLFLVFEHVDQDLNQYIERCPPPGLAPERIKDVMWQILSGVDFLHSHRIVHR